LFFFAVLQPGGPRLSWSVRFNRLSKPDTFSDVFPVLLASDRPMRRAARRKTPKDTDQVGHQTHNQSQILLSFLDIHQSEKRVFDSHTIKDLTNDERLSIQSK
jgi:hypothetical protein